MKRSWLGGDEGCGNWHDVGQELGKTSGSYVTRVGDVAHITLSCSKTYDWRMEAVWKCGGIVTNSFKGKL